MGRMSLVGAARRGCGHAHAPWTSGAAPSFKERTFVRRVLSSARCHVTNDDVAADALIIGDTGTERIPPRTARWLKGTSVIWNTTPTRSTNLFVDRCEVTGFGTGALPTAPVPAEVAQARLAGARVGAQIVAAKAGAVSPPLPGGPVASDIVLSAQKPKHGGSALAVNVFSFGGIASELMVMVPENVYAIGATPPDGSDGSNMNSAVDVRVEVARTPSKTASVSCSMTNASDRAATFSGTTIAPHATLWLDMQSGGTVGQDDVFVLRDPNFWSSIAINECRVRMQASVATSPGSIGPAAGGGTPPLNPPGNTPPQPIPQPGLGATRPPGPPIRGR